MENIIKIIDNYDNELIYLVETDFTPKELEDELSLLDEDMTYPDQFIAISEKYPNRKLDLIMLDSLSEVYI
jgi:hypothetical protein